MTSTCEAAVLHGADRPVSIEEAKVRDPGPGEVRVAIKAAGLCHSDLSVIDGSIPYPVPVVLGHEGGGGRVHRSEGDVGPRRRRRISSTLAQCGAASRARWADRRSVERAQPKEKQPFTVQGSRLPFANASAFIGQTVVREQSAIPIDARVPFDARRSSAAAS